MRIPSVNTKRPLRTIGAPVVAAGVLLAGALLRASPLASAAETVWMIGLVLTGAPVVWRTVRGLVAGRFAADVVASLALLTAVMLGQPIVGLVVVLMQTGGEALERFAEGRATEAVRALEAAAPRTAHRLSAGGIEEVLASELAPGQTIVIRPGELVPCDAEVTKGSSHVDTSRLTGEPLPVSAAPGTRLMSGSVNGEGALTATALASAADSQYARIVQLVREAQASRAPLQRLADRSAIWFTPLTIALCAIAYAVSGDATRVLAVLAVATPCPLILATPVALLGGINRAARRHVIVRHGNALERLGTVTIAVFDKTGTITIGRPSVSRIVPAMPFTDRELLGLAAAVELHSGHLLARTLVEAAEARGVRGQPARDVVEKPGRGVAGWVDAQQVVLGARTFVLERFPAVAAELEAFERLHGLEESLRAYVAVDGRLAGVIEYADALRPELPRVLAELAQLGIARTMVLSGDRAENARAIANRAGIAEVTGDLLPHEKVAAVRALRERGESVLMVGDGTNDAPALSAATVGAALAGHGGGITAEAADVVVLTDDLARVVDAIRISRRTMRIARESIVVGLGLSVAAMLAAAGGAISPIAGALIQEGIDLAVILNALRASREPRADASTANASALRSVIASENDGRDHHVRATSDWVPS